jgi:hypothetical protein
VSLDLVDTVGLTRGADVVHAVATHCVFQVVAPSDDETEMRDRTRT